MSDMAYIMETQDPQELWLVEGDQKFKVSRDMYWLLVSQGADMPPVHEIADLLAENAKLVVKLNTEHIVRQNVEIDNAKLREFLQNLADHIKSDDGFGIDCGWVLSRLRELGIEVE